MCKNTFPRVKLQKNLKSSEVFREFLSFFYRGRLYDMKKPVMQIA